MSGTTFAETLIPRILSVSINEEYLTLALEDGRVLSVPILWYPRLAYGTDEERQNFEISGGGFGIHWPQLDEDIGVKGVLMGKKSAESPESLQKWLERRSCS
jgi:hypothetical protein